MIYLTGDTHRNFGRIWDFVERMETTRDDILIILGDAGINYYLNHSDLSLKEELIRLPLTLLCIKGNHELHADQIGSYEEVPCMAASSTGNRTIPICSLPRTGRSTISTESGP